MYAHHIKDMADEISKDKTLTGKQKVAVHKALSKYWEDKIAIVWEANDVISEFKQNHKRCSKEKANDILTSILEQHDCNFGVTWDTIREYMS